MNEWYCKEITEASYNELITLTKWINEIYGYYPFIIGGWDGARTLSTIFQYKADSVMQIRALLPYSVECHSVAVNENVAFLTGGFDGIQITDKILLIDLISFETKELPLKLKAARENHCSEIAEDQLIVCAGWDGFKPLKSVEVFRILPSFPFLQYSHSFELDIPRNRPCIIKLP